jgi:prepilin-type processing-associated H-X9-DG protein
MNLVLPSSDNPGYQANGQLPVAKGSSVQWRPTNTGQSAAYRPFSVYQDPMAAQNKANWLDGSSPYAELCLAFEWGGLGSRANAKLTDQISSRHGGTIVASYCDGHTTQLNEQMDINVFKHIMAPYDVQTVSICPTGEMPNNLLDEAQLP